MKCKCGANLYRISGLTRYDNRDGIREAAWCDSCYTLFSSHAFGLSEIVKLTDKNKFDHLRARNAELERAYDAILDDCRIQEKRNAELEAEVAQLRKALETTREYLMGGKWIYDKSPDEFIKATLEASDGNT